MKINEIKYAINMLIVSMMQSEIATLERACYMLLFNEKEVNKCGFSCKNERLKFLFYEKLGYFEHHNHQKNLPKLYYLLANE